MAPTIYHQLTLIKQLSTIAQGIKPTDLHCLETGKIIRSGVENQDRVNIEFVLLEFFIGGKSGLGGLACNILCRTAAAGNYSLVVGGDKQTARHRSFVSAGAPLV